MTFTQHEQTSAYPTSGLQAGAYQTGAFPPPQPQFGYSPWNAPQPPAPTRPGQGQKWAAGLVAAALAAGLTYYLTSRSDAPPKPLPAPAPVVSSPSVIVDPPLPPVNPPVNPSPVTPPPVDPTPVTPPPVTPPPVNPPTGPGVAAWPQALAPFTALIGTGEGSTDAWHGAQCSTVQGTDGTIAIAVRCTEPDGTTLKLVDFADSTSVQKFVAAAPSQGGTVKSWSHNNGPQLGQVVIWPSNPPEIATTFAAHPTFVVEIFGGSGLDAVQADWTAAPLPTD